MGIMTIIGATKKKNTKTQMTRKLQCQMRWEGLAYCGNAVLGDIDPFLVFVPLKVDAATYSMQIIQL